MAALRCAALHGTALRCAVMRCDAMRCVALRCMALHCAALHGTALRCTALRRRWAVSLALLAFFILQARRCAYYKPCRLQHGKGKHAPLLGGSVGALPATFVCEARDAVVRMLEVRVRIFRGKGTDFPR